MAENKEQVQVDNSTEEQWKDPELQKLEDDVKNLVDEDSKNDPEKLSVPLTTGFVETIPEDAAKEILERIEKKYPNGEYPESLKNLVAVLKPIANPVIMEWNTISDAKDTEGGSFYRTVESGKNNETVTQLKEKLKSYIGSCSSDSLQNVKSTLTKIQTIIEYPTNKNTKDLQIFILGNLKGDEYNKFLNDNFLPKWKNVQRRPDEPDGYFGKNTLDGVDKFLTKCEAYIKQVQESENIQEKADQETNKPGVAPTDNVDTGLDDLSTNVDYQALQSFAKLAEASEAASQAISAHQEELKALIDNGKIDKEPVNRVQENTESFLKWAGELKIYQSVGQLSNMISDYNSKSEQLNKINEEINRLQSEWNKETQIAELQEQANNLKSEMDNLNLSIMEAKREYGVTMLWKDALQQKLNDGLPLAVNIIKDWILMINQILLALDNNEESGNEELKKTLKDYQDSLLTVSGFKIENWNVVPDNNAPSWSMSKYTIPPLDTLNSGDLLKSYPFFNPEMKSKLFSWELPNWDKAARMDIRDITYTVNVDRNGNICPIATGSDKHLIWSNYPVMFENYQPCINYLWSKAQEAGLKVEIARNDKMKDYVLRSYGCWITIEPMTMNGDWMSGSFLTDLKLLNLTNRLRSGVTWLDWKNPDLKITKEWLQVKKEWRGWMPINLKSFGFTNNEIWDTKIWQRYKKYNNHEDWEDNWDLKKKNSDYKRVTL